MSEVIIKPLTKNDIKKNTNIILINTIRSVFEINSINKKINDHTLLVIRNFEINWQKSSIINSWIEQDKIRKFSWHVFSVEIECNHMIYVLN